MDTQKKIKAEMVQMIKIDTYDRIFSSYSVSWNATNSY